MSSPPQSFHDCEDHTASLSGAQCSQPSAGCCRRRPRRTLLLSMSFLALVLAAVVALVSAAPAIARGVAAGAQMSLRSVELSELREASMRLRVKATVRLPKPPLTPPCVSQPANLTLSYDFGGGAGGPAGAVTGRRVLGTALVPGLSLGAETDLDVSGVLEVADSEALAALLQLCLRSDEDLELEVSGSVSAKMMGLDLGELPLKLGVRTWGLSAIRKMTMTGFELFGNDSTSVLVNATVDLHNPSGLVVRGLGDVDVEISLGGKSVGSIRLPQLDLRTGTSALVGSGHVRPTDPTAVAKLFSSWLMGDTPSVDYKASAGGSSSAPSWVRAALAALVGSVAMPAFQGPPLVSDLEVPSLSLATDAAGLMTASASVHAAVQTPFGFPIEVLQMEARANVLDDSGRPVAVLEVPASRPEWRPQALRPGSGRLSVAFADAKVQMLDAEGFGRASSGLVGNSSTMRLNGTTVVTTRTVVGELKVEMPTRGLVVRISPGFDGFPGMAISAMDMLDGGPGRLDLRTSLTVPNPSNVSLYVERCVPTIVSLKGIDIGYVNACGTSIGEHSTTNLTGIEVQMRGTENRTLLRMQEAIVRYINGVDTLLDIRGDPARLTGPGADFMRPSLGAFRSQTMMKGLPGKIITSADLGISIDLTRLPSLFSPVTLHISNPWSGNMSVVHLSAKIFAPDKAGYGLLLAEIVNLDLAHDPLQIAGRHAAAQPQVVHPVPVHLLLGSCGLGHLKACVDDVTRMFAKGSLPVRIDCTMQIVVGHGYALEARYVHDGVPVSLKLLAGENATEPAAPAALRF